MSQLPIIVRFYLYPQWTNFHNDLQLVEAEEPLYVVAFWSQSTVPSVRLLEKTQVGITLLSFQTILEMSHCNLEFFRENSVWDYFIYLAYTSCNNEIIKRDMKDSRVTWALTQRLRITVSGVYCVGTGVCKYKWAVPYKMDAPCFICGNKGTTLCILDSPGAGPQP